MTNQVEHAGGAGRAPRSSGMGIASVVFGILAVVSTLGFCTWPFGLAFGVIGLVAGVIGWISAARDSSMNKRWPIAGTVLSLIPLVVILFAMVTGATADGLWMGGPTGEREQTTPVTRALTEADTLAEQARAAGVDPATITTARAELDATLETVITDIADAERAENEVSQALAQFRATLEQAAGTTLEGAEIPQENTDTDPSMFDDEYPVPESGNQQ